MARRFGANILFELTLPVYYRLLLFSFVQFTQFSPLPCAIGGLSLALAVLALLASLAIPGLIAFRMWQGRHPLEYNYPLKEPSVAQLYYPLQEYVKRLLICVFLVAAYAQPVAQAALVAAVLLGSIVYWCLARGLERRMGFYLCIFAELGLLGYAIFLAVFAELAPGMSSAKRESIGVVVLVVLIFYLAILLVWQLARAYVDMTLTWRRFKETDFYYEYVETEEDRLRRWEQEQLAKSDLSEKLPILEPNTRA